MDTLQWYLYLGYGPFIAIASQAAALFLGWFVGKLVIKKNTHFVPYINESYQGAIFGLVALVVGFTFANAINHYDDRKENGRTAVTLIANSYNYSDYLLPADRDKLRSLINDYLHMRLSLHENIESLNDIDAKATNISNFGRHVLGFTLEAIERDSGRNKVLANELLKPQVILMLENYEKGRLLLYATPNMLIYLMLFSFLGVTGFIGGYEMTIKHKRDLIFTFLYAVVITATLYLIFSMAFPASHKLDQLRFNRELLQLKDHL